MREFSLELGKDRTTMRQIAEMILKGRKSCDHLALYLEGRQPVGNALLCLWKDIENCSSERFQCSAFWLRKGSQVPINFAL